MKLMSWIWTPTFLIALGGVISLVGTIWAAKEQANSEKISKERAEKTLAFMLGSHSFTIDHQVSEVNGKEVLTIFLKNTGEFPCYGLTFRAIDIDAHGSEEISSIEDILKKPSPIHEKYWGDIGPEGMVQAVSLVLKEHKIEHNFKVYLNSRKDRTNFKIKFLRDSTGNWGRIVDGL